MDEPGICSWKLDWRRAATVLHRGEQKLFGMSKRGNVYLRRMLIHGARAVLLRVNFNIPRRFDSSRIPPNCFCRLTNREVFGPHAAIVGSVNRFLD